MNPAVYVRFEILRTVRNRRFFIFSLIFPLVLYVSVVSAHRHQTLDGVPFPLYYMTGMVTFGSMAAITAGGARIALERSLGWTRQMRITPLTAPVYFGSKILSGYLMAALSIVLIYAAGISFGVHLSAGNWVVMTGLILVGLVPFAVLGILLGHLLKPDSLGPVLGGGTSMVALLGGAFGPLATGGVFLAIVKCIPSYWLVQAGKSAVSGQGWPAEAWIVIAVWTGVLTRLAFYVYGRDTARA
jgi:ABC-2 type transport system permease protein